MYDGKKGNTIIHSDTVPAICPLTKTQLGIYLDCVDKPGSIVYNIPVRLKLPGSINKERFMQAVKTAASKHKALFVTIGTPDGVPSMIYKDEPVQISECSADSIEEFTKSFRRPFNLTEESLYRFAYLTTPQGDAFFLDIHHIIFDGTSLNRLVAQIADVYNGKECGDEALTLFDVAQAENEAVDTEAEQKMREYFDSKFSGNDCDSKPVPDCVEKNDFNNWGFVSVDTRKKLSENKIKEFIKNNKISENALFLGAFGYALAKFNGVEQSVFTTAYHGRFDRRLSDTVGMFVKTLPFNCEFNEDEAPADYLGRVYDDYYITKKNESISFGELAAEYGLNMSVSFVYHSTLFSDIEIENEKVSVELLIFDSSVADIEVMVKKTESGYITEGLYLRSDYTEDFLRSFIDMFVNIVNGMLDSSSLKEIEFVNEDSIKAIEELNRTEYDYAADKTVVDLFREQVEKTPDKICLVYLDRKFTYRQVDEITDRLAQHLVSMGVGKETVTGVLIPRCEYMVICSLGVLKAGGAYMPLDPSYPPERLNFMMQDTGAKVLIYAPELSDIITDDFKGERLSTEVIPTLENKDVVLPVPQPSDLFIMLYTSGSTGLPKGVMYNHSNAMVTTEWVKKYYEITEASNVSSYASYGFDANVYDTYPAITSGAEFHIIDESIRLDLIAVRDYFNENGITHAVMTTQVGRQFALMGGLKTLKHLTVAGEKLAPVYVEENFTMYNVYGPSEASVVTSAFPIDRLYKDIPIGKAVDNLKMYIVDKNGRLLPFGAVGELWVAGPHVTRGYLNRPDKTAEAYGTNPFCKDKGYERVYRTGDIVRLMSDGNLIFVGRRDAQVKVRGFRVELTEVEEVIRRFSGIKDATVVAFDEPSGGKYVTAYVVSDGEVDIEALNEFIRSEKPPYMVPAVTMQIDKIPLTQNQKVNKRALPVPQRKVENIVPPENDVQQKIFDIIADVVGHRDFGIETDIYEAGLTSIGAVKLNVSLSQEFDIPVKISDIKENSTVKKLEVFLSASEKTEGYEKLADYPITQTQNGIFVECSANPDSVVYNIPVLFKLDNSLEPEKLAGAVRTAINAHPYVKTTLRLDEKGEIRAVRNDDAEPEVRVIRCQDVPDKTELVTPFKLMGEPLYRVAVYVTDGGNYLFMDFHHIISDGTSEAILIGDIEKAYAGEKLTAEKYSGFEAALDEQKSRESEKYETAKAYYDSIFAGCDAECLPPKSPETAEESSASITHICSVNPEHIEKYCQDNKLTLNAFFNAVFGVVLGRFDHRDEVVYTTVYNGRSDSRLADSMTMLVKTVPVFVGTNAEKKTVELVRDVQEQLMNSFSNDIYSFAEISRAYNIKSDIIFVYQGDGFEFNEICGKKAELVDVLPAVAKAPLTVNVYKRNGAYELVADYRTNVFSRVFIENFISSIERGAVSLADNEYIKNISVLSEESRKVITKTNDTKQSFRNISVNRMIEENVEKHPDKTAVIANGESLTYGEMNARANRIAHSLKALGIRADSIVGIVTERTVDVSVTELAILKAGGAFLAMLPSYPDDRIDFCLTNADSPLVITTDEIKASRPELFAENKPYITKTVNELLENENTENLNLDIDAKSLAYCIYTSGSTGTPKGVMIEHHNLANFVQTDFYPYEHYSGRKAGAVGLAVSSVSFDMSIFDNIMHLCNGETVCMATEDDIHNPMQLAKLMIDNKVEMMSCTPSFINNYVSMAEFRPALKNIKTIVVGAEAFPGTLYTELKKINPDMNIINGYGPTECTISCCAKVLAGPKNITIGSPSANTEFYVVDKYGNILPPYACGELIICGECAGRGYVKLPEKNKAAFFTMNGRPAYHSGDLVRMNNDGEIEFCGRIDNQVKLRGFRVELDEIENVICSFDSVKQSKVIVRNNGAEDYLAGFFTADSEVDVEKLTAYLKTKLTYYMVPDILMQLDKMPLTPSGKIDKKALPESKKASKKSGGRRAPKKSLEQRLCEIYASVLSLDEVFADDNFFELGGTSLSAAKVTMMLMSDGIEVKYGDIFDNPTPEELSDFIQQRNIKEQAVEEAKSIKNEPTRETLKYNKIKYSNQVKREPLGNVLLTGAVGFLGIHVLKELLEIEEGHIWCLVRKGSHESPEIRLKTMLIYYFSQSFEQELRDRITILDADITDNSLEDALKDIPFDTVINCAACVKHFADDDVLERINVTGVENLIAVCKKKNARLIQISTVSVPGIHTQESWENQVRMHESELFVIDHMDNKYGISKYHAELKLFDAIDNGLRGKVIRVGNLMGRHSDGEFQANLETNMFLSGIRGFALMGKYPISHMIDPMKFSPVDCTARAVVLLAGTNDMFTAFNADNRYGFDEMKVIDACNRNGIKIVATEDEAYYEEFRQKLGDDRINAKLSGLAAYDIKDAHAVETDNLFTTNILYRIGFSWPLVDDTYLDRAINSVLTLDYFGMDELEN